MVYRGELVSGICLAPLGRPPYKENTMYPQIHVKKEDNKLVVTDQQSEDERTWDSYRLDNKKDAVGIISMILWHHPHAFITLERDTDLRGYLFKIRGPQSTTSFFREEETVRNPFSNRKMYAIANKESVVSFHALGFE